MNQKIIFIDRDGTIISEPLDNFQVDNINKLYFEPNVIPNLLKLQNFGYQLVMITNQDGLGSNNFSQDSFEIPHHFMLKILNSQGINFNSILICPHTLDDQCQCRKPKIQLVAPWLIDGILDKSNSYVIGDRITDMQLAKNMGIKGIHYSKINNWDKIYYYLMSMHRYACIVRNTKETQIKIQVWLDIEGKNQFNTGIGFFDHMLNQIAIHGKFSMHINAHGDIHVDDHHTVEDTGLALGEALLKALGNKKGISRFGFTLPMDESYSSCLLDISGRPYLKFKAKFNYQKVGTLSTDMIEHFFRSLSYSMCSTIHLKSRGKNDHHQIESLFKVFGCALNQAFTINGNIIPSSKESL